MAVSSKRGVGGGSPRRFLSQSFSGVRRTKPVFLVLCAADDCGRRPSADRDLEYGTRSPWGGVSRNFYRSTAVGKVCRRYSARSLDSRTNSALRLSHGFDL